MISQRDPHFIFQRQLLLIAQAHTQINFCEHDDDSRLCVLMLYSCETARTRRQPFTASHPVSRDPNLSYTQAKAEVAADEKLKEDKRKKHQTKRTEWKPRVHKLVRGTTQHTPLSTVKHFNVFRTCIFTINKRFPSNSYNNLYMFICLSVCACPIHWKQNKRKEKKKKKKENVFFSFFTLRAYIHNTTHALHHYSAQNVRLAVRGAEVSWTEHQRAYGKWD